MMVASTTGNPFFGLLEGKMNVFAPAFVFMLIEEIPTFILALGSAFSVFRSDLGFGISFFLLRICYHTYFLVYGLISGVDFVVTFLFILTLTMHLNWFYTWVIKYGNPSKTKDQKKKMDPKASD